MRKIGYGRRYYEHFLIHGFSSVSVHKCRKNYYVVKVNLMFFESIHNEKMLEGMRIFSLVSESKFLMIEYIM
jgi:hypothetical protein